MTQPDLLSALIMIADPNDQKLIDACEPFRKRRSVVSAFRQVEQMSKEEREALMRKLKELEAE